MRTVASVEPVDSSASLAEGEAGLDASDAELLRLVPGGSEAAFVALWARSGAAVYSVCRRILVDRGSAEDAAQEAFVRIWRNARQFDPRHGSAAAWMYTIVRNTTLNLAFFPPARQARVAHHMTVSLALGWWAFKRPG